MFGSKRKGTVIAEGLKIVGSVTAEGSVELNGHMDGELHCTSLVISPTGHVAGTVEAERVVVDGKVDGPIRGGDVVLKSQARVVGDIRCTSLIVEKGASVNGRLTRVQRADGRQPKTAKTATPPSDVAKADAAQDEEAELLAGVEASTRIVELGVEARHLSGNPSLLNDEGLAFLAKRGNAEAKAFLNAARTPSKGSSRTRVNL